MRTLLVLACSLLALPSFGYELRRDSEGDIVRWARPVRFVLDERLEATLRVPGAQAAIAAALEEAGAAVAKVTLKQERGGRVELGYHPDDGAWGNVVMALDVWPFERGNVAATIVTVNARTNEILDADVVFNAEEYDFTVLEVTQMLSRVHDVQTVFTHELGHVLGLQHEAGVREAVMYPAATPGQFAKRALAPDDRNGLQALYGGPGAAVEEPAEEAAGCQAAPGAALLGSAWPVLLLALRRRGRAQPAAGQRLSARRGAGWLLTLGLLLAGPALASAPPLSLEVGPEVERAMYGEVVFSRSFWVDARRGLMATEVEVRVDVCVRGACEVRTVVVRRPGGRIGDLEQSVTHQPALEVGDGVLLTWTKGRVRLAGHAPKVRALPGR